MKKNDIKELVITDISDTGSGIGRIDNMVVFVPLAAVGDRVLVRILKVKKSYAFGKIEEIISPSPDRTDADCPVFSRCGGCSFRHINYQSEYTLKQKRVYDCIKRIGGIDMPPQDILYAENTLRYRNKAQYPIAPDGSVGFYATHSHRIIPCSDCILAPIEFSAAAKAVSKWIAKSGASVYNEETAKGLLRHLYLRKAEGTGEIMAVLVINGDTLPDADGLVNTLKNTLGTNLKSVLLNINKKATNVILGDKNILLFGSEYITDTLCGVSVRLSAHSFYQVNRTMAQSLYEKAAEYAKPDNKIVLDLYCGAGTIGLSMAKRAKRIIGVEIVLQAVEDAKINAKNNGIENAEFICGDAAFAAQELKNQGVKPDVVILDPPRKGCDEALLKTIAKGFAPEKIVYVSCDPATLARDIAILTEFGYILKEYTPVDLFPRTAHVETVVCLKRLSRQ